MSIGKICSSCGQKVIPTRDGFCPSCRLEFSELETFNDEYLNPAAHSARNPEATTVIATSVPSDTDSLLSACYWCETKVIPTKDRHCPACRRFFLGPKELNSLTLESRGERANRESKLSTIKGPRRNQTVATALTWSATLSGLLILLSGVFAGSFLFPEILPWLGREGLIFDLLTGGLLGLAGGLAGYMFRSMRSHSERFDAPGADTILQASQVNFTLLLRSFDEDATKFFSHAERTFEQEISSLLEKAGPAIAVGRPKEGAPPLGAARGYLDDQDWKEVVLELISRAHIAVIIPGIGDGIIWESMAAAKAISPQRLLIALPRPEPETQTVYDKYRRAVRDIFPKPLPAWSPGGRFIYFDGDWTPFLVSPKTRKSLFGGKTGLSPDTLDFFIDRATSL